MPSASDRIDFGPPRDAGSIRAFGLALLAHILLIIALTWGVNWKHTDEAASFSAELWTNVPPQAAQVVEPPPARVVPEPPPVAPPTPQPMQKAPEVQVAPPAPDVDIALEQEKKRKQLEQKKEAEAKKLADQKKATELAKKEKDKQDKAKQLAAAEEAKKAEAQKLAKQQANDKQAQASTEKLRQENLKRMLTGLPGEPSGTPSKSNVGGGGASRTYGAILRAAIKPNIVFTEEIDGNPMTKIEVRLQSDGTVTSQRQLQSSGNKAWDAAAENAITRTRVMPRDIDGRIPDTILIIEMRPRG